MVAGTQEQNRFEKRVGNGKNKWSIANDGIGT
uniref:Uncharacterized protein n=1 Tax=Coprothermobacter proteolyticus (strain ATCC 35245 / DSM 5265 / OCM 4 / BT) TaxID=309798 RepID=B5Y907_COPPD